jgi:hypothetical protein
MSNGRGKAPVIRTMSLHTEYPWAVMERLRLYAMKAQAQIYA